MCCYGELPGLREPAVESVGRLRELLPKHVILLLSLLLASQLVIAVL